MRFTGSAFILATLLGAGCVPSGPPMATVKGSVTVDGAPLEKGMIQFRTNTDSPASLEIKNGVYAGNAFIGLSRVLITSPKVVGKRKRFPTDDSPLDDVVEEGIPSQYNAMSGLQRDVKAGKNSFDFDLNTKTNQPLQPSN